MTTQPQTSTAPLGLPEPSLAPLAMRFSDVGIIEHSLGPRPNPPSGHCIDDAGRALGIAAMMRDDERADDIAIRCVRQLTMSRARDHELHLRLDESGIPTSHSPSDDATARAIWGLALATTRFPATGAAAVARRELERLRGFRSVYPRAAAHAVLGAVELLHAEPSSPAARSLLAGNVTALPRPQRDAVWPWPERRLTYSNALLCEALMAAGTAMHDRSMVADGLALLAWLVELERSPLGHFSFTPAHGRGPGDPGGFDQQPIEAWSMATACELAARIDGDDAWRIAVADAALWFAGRNDSATPMWDPTTGASYDGLRIDGTNPNQGAESTIALVGTLLAARAAADGSPRRRRSR